jgi:hypothetical protein
VRADAGPRVTWRSLAGAGRAIPHRCAIGVPGCQAALGRCVHLVPRTMARRHPRRRDSGCLRAHVPCVLLLARGCAGARRVSTTRWRADLPDTGRTIPADRTPASGERCARNARTRPLAGRSSSKLRRRDGSSEPCLDIERRVWLRRRGSPVEPETMEPSWQADPRDLPDAAEAVAMATSTARTESGRQPTRRQVT